MEEEVGGNAARTESAGQEESLQLLPIGVAESSSDGARLTISENGGTVNQADKNGDTALHRAAEGENECIYNLIEHGADLSAKNREKVSALDAILKKRDGNIEILEEIFNERIKFEGECINVDFTPLCPNGKRNQASVLRNIMETQEIDKKSRRALFSHPYLRAFVRKKWLVLRKLFYIHVGIYFMHVISLSVFVTLAHSDISAILGIKWLLKTAWNATPALVIVVNGTAVLVIVNASTRFSILKNRFRSRVELLRSVGGCLLSIVVSYLTVYDGNFRISDIEGSEAYRNAAPGNATTISTKDPESSVAAQWNAPNQSFNATVPPSASLTSTPGWVIHLTTIAVFFAWFEMMLLVGRFPKWASQALLYLPVLRSVGRVLVTYGCMIIGFAFVFFLEFFSADPDAYGDPLRALIKTMVMMMGEFEYMDMYRQGTKVSVWIPSHLPFASRIVFLCFLVLAAIALMNLMVGLAVRDTDVLMKKSTELQLNQLCQSVVYWEYIIDSISKWKLFPNYFRNKLGDWHSISVVNRIPANFEDFPEELNEDLKQVARQNSEESPCAFQSSSSIALDGDIKIVLEGIWDEIQKLKEMIRHHDSDGRYLSRAPRRKFSEIVQVLMKNKRGDDQ